MSASPGGAYPPHVPPPRSGHYASRRRARQKRHAPNSLTTRRPPSKKKGPPEMTALVTRRSVWGECGRPVCLRPLWGSKGELRWATQHPDNAHLRSKTRITAKWATAQCLANTRFFRFLRRLAQPSNYNLLPYVQFVLTFCNDWTLSSDAPSAPMLCRRDISAVIRSRTLATSTETATFVAPEVSALKSPR